MNTFLTTDEARYEIMQALTADFPSMPIAKKSKVIDSIMQRVQTNGKGWVWVDSLNSVYETAFKNIHAKLGAK
jgi:hypothetical protein